MLRRWNIGMTRAACSNDNVGSCEDIVRITSYAWVLLAVAIIALWIRSHITDDLITYSGGNGTYFEYVTIPGQFRITRVTGWVGSEPVGWFRGELPLGRPVFGQQAVYRAWTILGIGFDGGVRLVPISAARPVTVNYQITAVPFALPALVAAAIGLLPWLRRRRRRLAAQDRLHRGLCPVCGYDLRATTGRCPECGAVVSSG